MPPSLLQEQKTGKTSPADNLGFRYGVIHHMLRYENFIDYFMFRWLLLVMVIGNLGCSLISEMVLADVLVKKVAIKKNKKHELINKELDYRNDWPPVSPDNPILESSSTILDGQGSKEGTMRVVITKPEKENPLEYLLDTLGLPESKKDTKSASRHNDPPWRTHPQNEDEVKDLPSR